MKKILILGCSFTEGSFEPCDLNRIKGRKPWEAPDMHINHKGWWYFVDYFKDKDVTVVACSSLGYWAYYQLILFHILICKKRLCQQQFHSLIHFQYFLHLRCYHPYKILHLKKLQKQLKTICSKFL